MCGTDLSYGRPVHYICYHRCINKVLVDDWVDMMFNPYPFSTPKDANNAIKEIGEDNLKLYFGIDR